MFNKVLVRTALFVVLSAGPLLCQTPLAPGEHNVVLNGVRLWYKVGGQEQPGRAPLVFLPGGPGYNSYSFEKTIGSRLEHSTKVIYFDERGCGHSERPWTKNYDMLTLVEDIEALRKNLDVPQVSLMGHSFGGTIALEYAAHYPKQVQKLIILDGAADAPKIFDLWRAQIEQRYPAAWQSALSEGQGKGLQKAMQSKDECTAAKAEFATEMIALSKVDSQAFHNWQQFHEQRYQREQDALDTASGLRNTGELAAAYLGPDGNFPCYRFTAYSKLTMPALIVVGKYDGAVGVEQMRYLADRLPHAHFEEFDQSAHFVYAEEPDKFERNVAAFLAE